MSQPNAYGPETNYLISTVGPVLSLALAEVVERRPSDPIEYLASVLYKQVENIQRQKQRLEESNKLEKERMEMAQLNQQRQKAKIELEKFVDIEREIKKEELVQSVPSPPSTPPAAAAATRNPIFTVIIDHCSSPASEADDEVEIHREAARDSENLLRLIRENPRSMATRNHEGKTPRDIAVATGMIKNVEIIDSFCIELFNDGRREVLEDLILNGFDDFLERLPVDDDIDSDVGEQLFEFINRLEDLQDAISQGDASNVETISKNYPALALYRRADGTTALHDAIRSRQFEVAQILLDKIPSLAIIKDSAQQTAWDLFRTIDFTELNDEQRVRYELVEAILNSAKNLDLNQDLF